MTETNQKYIIRLQKMYRGYNDQDSLDALVELQKQDERIRELKVYREQPKTQELIEGAISRFRGCVEKLTNPDAYKNMTDAERAYCHAAMDWARYTLDVVGESPAILEQEIEKTVATYARRAGLSP